MGATAASTDELYPTAPENVPRDLTTPTGSYKRNAWLAFGGLMLFVALYLGLTGYLAWVVYRLVRDGIAAGNFFVSILLALAPLFFLAFLLRGLFVVKHRRDESLIEVTAAEEPALLSFVHRVADDTGAPRPHKVFLSARVNAAVFYDLSFWNLLFPSRKNLEIGLGLVEVLTLDELKAVVAHEFGHFAQRTMAVGRWVYTAEQIAGHVIVTRGWFDRALDVISRIDIRIAWIGWIMRLLVWAIRAVLDTFFRIVVLAHRALTREMELQADLVSVSVSGSDSLIHALHRLGPADDAWDRAVSFAHRELGKKRPVADLFAVQSRVLDHLRRVLDDEALGVPPPLPETPSTHRLFESGIAQPPRMWSTHPPNREREDNAKKRYLGSRIDARPAWTLFADEAAIRKRVTRAFLVAAFGPAMETAGNDAAPLEESLATLDDDFERPTLDRRYRGTYLGRSVVAEAERTDQLYDPPRDGDRDEIVTRLDALYPETLSADLEKWQELREERVLLEALKDGILTAPGGVIRHRGREIHRKHLAEVIEHVRSECSGTEDRVLAHDRACRSSHIEAARTLGRGWEDYLRGLADLLHYADHTAANVGDAAGYLDHVFRIIIADGRVSGAERRRMLGVADDVWETLRAVFAAREQVELPPAVAEELEKEKWIDYLDGAFDFGTPSEQNLGDWLVAVGSWTAATESALVALSRACLEVLLRAEAHVEECVRDGKDPGDAPPRAAVPKDYTTLVPGRERERQKKLDLWDRFQVADGFFPGLARFVVACALLAPALLLTGGTATTSSVTVYNGLAIPVEVDIDGERATVQPHGHVVLEPDATDALEIETRTADGTVVERFEADADNSWASYVYNVAGASPLIEWTAVYGSVAGAPERPIGAPRWTTTSATTHFTDPPRTVSGSAGSSGTTVLVLASLAEAPAMAQIEYVPDAAERRALIEAHVTWDPVEDPDLLDWVDLSKADPATAPALARRIAAGGHTAFWLRLEQTLAPDDAEVCARHRALAATEPEDPELAYASIRCVDDPAERGRLFLEAYARHEEHPWLAMGAGYEHARRGEWQDALALFGFARAPALGGVVPYVALDTARLRRLTSGDPRSVALADLAMVSRPLSYLLHFEGNDVPPDEADAAMVRPWQLLAGGDLAGAETAAALLPDAARHELLRLAAASDGAPATLVSRAFELENEQGISQSTVWSTIALAVREGRDASPFLEPAREMGDDDAELLLALVDGRLGADPAAMDDASHVRPDLRGQAHVMGAVLLGASAPPEWRAEARALLFARERPFLQ